MRKLYYLLTLLLPLATMMLPGRAYAADPDKALYDAAMEAIKEGSSKRNPYFEALKTMGLWEALNEAVEMAFN